MSLKNNKRINLNTKGLIKGLFVFLENKRTAKTKVKERS